MNGLLDRLRNLSVPVEKGQTPGLYFLFDGEELVYVGRSGSCQSRIYMHTAEGIKVFDRITIIHVAGQADRCRFEKELIERFKPKYNKCDLRDHGYVLLSEIAAIAKLGWGLDRVLRKRKVPITYGRGMHALVHKDKALAAIADHRETVK